MIHIVLNKDEILSMVEYYSSALGANRTTDSGKNMFDVLRMTSDDNIMFDKFISDANKNIIRKLLAWVLWCNSQSNGIFCLKLNGSDKFCIVENEIKRYLNDYILGEWFLIKGNKDADIYINRAAVTLESLPTLLHIKTYERKSNPF